jgi:hypothetical protein
MLAEHRYPWNKLQQFSRAVTLVVRSGRGDEQITPDAAVLALRCHRDLRTVLDDWEGQAVKGARIAGVPWAEVAQALGTTRQAAWERWHEVTAPLERPT